MSESRFGCGRVIEESILDGVVVVVDGGRVL